VTNLFGFPHNCLEFNNVIRPSTSFLLIQFVLWKPTAIHHDNYTKREQGLSIVMREKYYSESFNWKGVMKCPPWLDDVGFPISPPSILSSYASSNRPLGAITNSLSYRNRPLALIRRYSIFSSASKLKDRFHLNCSKTYLLVGNSTALCLSFVLRSAIKSFFHRSRYICQTPKDNAVAGTI
jgi:hypothetical protein